MKYLIIGNSAAGTGALESVRKADKTGDITILSDENYPLYSRCLLSYYLAGTIQEKGLRIRGDDFHKPLHAEVIYKKRAESVDSNRQTVICEDGSKYEFDKLLIATGASAKIPPYLPSDIEGIYTLRSVSDAMKIKKAFRKNGHAIVLGGGLVGLKAAYALNKLGMKVKVVLRSPNVLSQMVDFDAAQIVMESLNRNNIEVLTGSDIAEVSSRNGKLNSAKIEAGNSTYEESPCDILIAAKGVSPNIGMLEGTDIKKDWGIITDSKLRTNNENVYAAGDVAETYDIATEHRSVNALWTCAVQQGRVAGINMVGGDREYDGSVGMNSINFPGVDLISFGVIKPKESEEYQVLTKSHPEAGIYKKLVLKDGQIKGIIMVNEIDSAGILLSLLSRKIDVSGFSEELLKPNFNYGKVIGRGAEGDLQRLWNAGQKRGNA